MASIALHCSSTMHKPWEHGMPLSLPGRESPCEGFKFSFVQPSSAPCIKQRLPLICAGSLCLCNEASFKHLIASAAVEHPACSP